MGWISSYLRESARDAQDELPMQGKQKRLPSVQLSLNGSPIYMHNFQATASMNREEEDMSGQESSTKRSDKGVKSKELRVNGLIPYREKEWLTNIFKLAEATDKKGEQVKYRISNITAEAANMREGVFSGEVSASEDYVLGWNINFTLKEVNSVSEKKAKQKKKPKAKVQSEKAKASTSSASANTVSTASQSAAKTTQTTATDSKTKEIDDSIWAKINNGIGD